MGVFLRQAALPGLKNYKYSSIDHSLLSRHVLGPFWRWFVTLFPLWLAPNLVTLIGFSFVVINFLTVLYFNPTLDQECPRWIYVSYAIGLFMYQTFDACDGGQARRTGQSGPLGELFDHCVDACNTTLGVLVFAGASNMGYGWPVFIAQFATLCNFYLTTWEEYYTGTLFLSLFSGPVEGIIIVCCLFLATAAFGPGFWNASIVDIPGLFPLTFQHLYLIFGAVGLLFNIVTAAGNVLKSCREKKIATGPAMRGVIPYVLFYTTLFVWVTVSPILIQTYLLIPFMLGVGFSVALSVGRIITAHVTSQKFPVTNVLMLYPTIAMIFQLLGHAWNWDPVHTTTALVWIGFGSSVSVYGFFVVELVVEITTYLDIYCLSIKHKKVQ